MNHRKLQASIIFVFLQAFTLATFQANCNCLADVTAMLNIVLYFDIIITVFLYFVLALIDPGFISEDDLIYTYEQQIPKKVQIESQSPQVEHPTIQTVNMRSERQMHKQRKQGQNQEQEQDNLQPKEEKKQVDVVVVEENLDLECEASIDEKAAEKDPQMSFQRPSYETTKKNHMHSINSLTNSIPTNKEPKNMKYQLTQLKNMSSKAKAQKQHLNESSMQVQIQSPKDYDEIFERRYCVICNQEQLIRAKHCVPCGRCVAMYDHHCPWVANCIGERNKGIYYWFLFFLLVEISMASTKFLLNHSIDRDRITILETLIIVLALGFVAFIFIMVIILLTYHLYIAALNQTTWEHVSWYKISYLKEFPQTVGSPFSKGIVRNYKFMCRIRVPKLTNWNTKSLSTKL